MTDLFDRLRAVLDCLEGEATNGSDVHRHMADIVTEALESLEKAERLSQQLRDACAVVGPAWFVSAETTLAEAIEMKTKALEADAAKAEAEGALEALERAEGRIDDELSRYGLARQNGPDNYDEARAEGRDEASLIVHEEAARWREVSDV